jgi:hypothetical protein
MVLAHSSEPLMGGSREPMQPAGVRFIEFFGLPGSGKSTVAARLAEHLRQAGIAPTTNFEAPGHKKSFGARQLGRLWLVLSQLPKASFLIASCRIARFVVQSGQDSITDMVRVIWNLWSTAAFIASKRSLAHSVTLMDQGLLQGIWSVLLTGKGRRTAEDWSDILAEFGTSDFAFVLLVAPRDLARARLLARGDDV